MSRPKSTLLIAAGLMTCLSACVSGPLAISEGDKPAARATLAPICPTPTPDERLTKIAGELTAAIKAGVSPDTLAGEWERLDEASRECRGT